MGICHSKVAPYIENSHKRASDYATSIEATVINAMCKIRYTLLTSKTLSTPTINTEGLIDYALVSLYTSIIITENDFARHYKFCCMLLYHSSFIISRLHTGLMKQQEETSPIEVGDEPARNSTPDDTLRLLLRYSSVVQEHPLLTWTSIMIGIVPDYDALSQVFGIFRLYCHALLNYLCYCSRTDKLPPQIQYRTELQNYDPSYVTPFAYASECRKLDEALTTLMTLCEHARENNAASSRQPQDLASSMPLRPCRINSYVPTLAPVDE